MIKYSVMYPNTENGHFDHDYYRDVHLPLIKERMGKYLVSYSIEKNIVTPEGSPAPWIAACHLFCHSAENLQKGMEKHIEEIVGDVANFTNIKSVKWIADVVV